MGRFTFLYLIRHSIQLKDFGKILTEEDAQIKNEKIILTCEGERKAEELSKIDELLNISELWSSSYVRAISTAKYISEKNNIKINIDKAFNERKLR